MIAPADPVPSDAGRASAQLSLLGGFELRIDGVEAALPMHARRVIAYLALRKSSDRECTRQVLAERLWEDSPPVRSLASLRTALWRIRRVDPHLLTGDTERVALADHVEVDVHCFRRYAEGLLSGITTCVPPDVRLLCGAAELLPGWDEDWLMLFREQVRMLRLHTLEAVARRLCEQGRHPQAIDLILWVVAEEPLRESARAVLIDAHLGAGNAAEAHRQFHLFATGLWHELALRPSPELGRRLGLPAAAATGH
ncbi:BTAD domain-containing putative transcriptional regulator [Nocardia sp. NPDC058519]|uniref:AfsR/SARP family transcriptional regulator n=1 Tax=Nocardia sp. NPDC058519 TaxID=3346535 RepID=UPI00365F31A7